MKFSQQFSQQQKQIQKLAMTQQLQQAIQMLQYNSDDLQSFIQQKALENPLIELDDRYVSSADKDYAVTITASRDASDQKNAFLEQIPNQNPSLFEYLWDQIYLTMRETPLREAVLFLLEYVDDMGFLRSELEDAQSELKIDSVQMLDALTLLQQLDPPGVGARNLQECLMLQTERDDLAPNLAYIILEEEFEDFVDRKWDKIAKKYQVPQSEVQGVFDYVQTLTPTPGAAFEHENGLYIHPDLIVSITEQQEIQLKSTRLGQPTIIFQSDYFQEMSATDSEEVQRYLSEKKQEFDWIKRSLAQRGETILRVGQTIVEHQQAFFLNDEHPLKPLLLKEVAQELKIHESTVSRTINGKYLQTDFGVFELKHFFSKATNGGESDISTDSVLRVLKKLVDDEDKQKPLSDQKIVESLKQHKITISRRTVAKYRDVLGIRSSSKRKRFDD